jgi:hypothetical protein
LRQAATVGFGHAVVAARHAERVARADDELARLAVGDRRVVLVDDRQLELLDRAAERARADRIARDAGHVVGLGRAVTVAQLDAEALANGS